VNVANMHVESCGGDWLGNGDFQTLWEGARISAMYFHHPLGDAGRSIEML